jgi:hypothetical protein
MQIRVPRLLGIHCRRQPNHFLPARRRRAHRRRHRRGRPHAGRDGAHRPHPGHPFAPGPCAVHRPAGRQRHAQAARRRPAAGARARAAGNHRGAAPAHLQRRDLARLHPPARSGPAGAGASTPSRSARCCSWAHAGSKSCPPATPCRPWATPCWHGEEPGSSPATPGPTRRCGSGWPACPWPSWSSRPPSATTSRNWPASASTCARPGCWKNWPSSIQPTEVCITHIKPGELEAVMTEVGRLDTRHHIRALMPGQVTDLGAAG